mgnify:CR=1 FL=1|jgi:hypothetical protein
MFLHPELETKDSKKNRRPSLIGLSTQSEVGVGTKDLPTRLNLFSKVTEAFVTTTNEFFRYRNSHFQPMGIKLTNLRLCSIPRGGHGLSIAVEIAHLAYFHFDNFPSPMPRIFSRQSQGLSVKTQEATQSAYFSILQHWQRLYPAEDHLLQEEVDQALSQAVTPLPERIVEPVSSNQVRMMQKFSQC